MNAFFFTNFQIFMNFLSFSRFLYKIFSYSELQSRAYHHQIRHNISHLTVHIQSRGKVVIYRKPIKNVIIRRLKLRRFTQNQINLPQKVSQNHQTVKTGQSKIAIRQKFIIKHPRIQALPTQLQFFIKITRIEFPGNQVKTYISLELA